MSLDLYMSVDEDIPTPSHDEQPVAVKNKSNEVRIGPMTRAHAKLLEQQVNLFLAQTDICIDENFILPKSVHVCMIRFEGIATIARGGEGLHQEEPKEMIIHGCAREEREAGARQEEDVINEKTASEKLQTPTGLSGPRNTGLSGRTEIFAKED